MVKTASEETKKKTLIKPIVVEDNIKNMWNIIKKSSNNFNNFRSNH